MDWTLLISSISWFNGFVIGYYVVVDGLYTFLFLISLFGILHDLRKSRDRVRDQAVSEGVLPPVSILLPAYNLGENLVEAVRGLTALRYPDYEIVVVNDGSTDQTLELLRAEFGLEPVDRIYRRLLPTRGTVRGFYVSPNYSRLIVVDKEHSGRGDSMNTAMNVARNPYFCTVDGSTFLEEDALQRLIGPVLEDADRIVACGGIVRMAGGCRFRDGRMVKIDLPRKSLDHFQAVESLRNFLTVLLGWSRLGSLLTASEHVMLFHKQTVQKVGGYRDRGPDAANTELVVRLHRVLNEFRQQYQILLINETVGWALIPSTLRKLRWRRERSQIGIAGSLFAHSRMFLNPGYRRIGLFGMPLYGLVEVLGPVFELGGYFTIGFAYHQGALEFSVLFLFLFLAVFYGIFLSVGSVMISEYTPYRYPAGIYLFKLVFYAVLENLGYRQLNTWWKLKGLGRFLLGNRGDNIRGSHLQVLWEY